MKFLIKSVLSFFAILGIFVISHAPLIRSSANEREVIRVGVYDNKPKIYQEDGEIKGFFADIIREIAKKQNWELEFVHGTWTEGLERLQKGDINLMVDVAVSEDRKEIYDFNNETVLINWAAIYTRPGIEMKSFYDLEGKKIAVMKNGIHYVGVLGIKNLVDGFSIKDATFVEVDIYSDVFALLDKGEADVGIVNRVFGVYNEPDYNVVRSNVVFNPIELRFALTKGASINGKLVNAIDKELVNMKKDYNSVYYQSLMEYLRGFEYEVEVLPYWAQVTIVACVSIMIILFATLLISKLYQSRLECQVKARTQQIIESNKKYRELYLDSQQKVKELEVLTKAAVGRELKMKDLKEEIVKLKKKPK